MPVFRHIGKHHLNAAGSEKCVPERIFLEHVEHPRDAERHHRGGDFGLTVKQEGVLGDVGVLTLHGVLSSVGEHLFAPVA